MNLYTGKMVVGLLGLGCIAAGLWMIYIPAALIGVGVLLIASMLGPDRPTQTPVVRQKPNA